MDPRLHISEDAERLAEEAARHWTLRALEAIEARGVFHACLSGGSTPKRLYQRLAEGELAKSLDWSRIHLWFGDERCVPPDHPDSNYRMVHEALISHIAIPERNVHRIHGELSPEDAASRYARELVHHLPDRGDGLGRFDLLMLGMGDDGHTASLFPGTAALQEHERPAVAVYVPKLQSWRITITYPLIERAREIMLLVAGAAKADVVAQVLGGAPEAAEYPVARVRAPEGELVWWLDRAAAARLPEAP